MNERRINEKTRYTLMDFLAPSVAEFPFYVAGLPFSAGLEFVVATVASVTDSRLTSLELISISLIPQAMSYVGFRVFERRNKNGYVGYLMRHSKITTIGRNYVGP